jgi:hypothetical protein
MAAEIRVKKNVPIRDGAADTNGIVDSMTISFVAMLICEDENETSIKKPSNISS